MTGKNYYSEHSKFYVAIDCIIFGFNEGELDLLLLKRNFEPAKGEWSLMGGFVRDSESVDQAASRVLYELTGLDNVYMEQVKTFGGIDRDPGERVISVAYYALINVNDYDKNLVRMHNAHWVNVYNLPKLIFDHNDMVRQARLALQKKTSSEPVGFNLLPEKFTLSQLQVLYEAIFGKKFDKRNFRRKLNDIEYIEETGEIDKKNSKRGARLYRFAKEIYSKDIKFNINF